MSIYRNVVWFTKGNRTQNKDHLFSFFYLIKGLSEYTKSGYETAAKHFNAADLEVDLSQRSIMVTGANSGIGKSCAMEVAKRGAIVHMVCRNKERGEAAQKEIITSSKNNVSSKFTLLFQLFL